jgi:NitT/TauT family transport system substrate-binding protein
MGILTAIAIQPVEDQGKGHILGWQGDEAPAEYGGLVTTSQMIREHRTTLEKVVRGFQKATREFNAAFDQLDAAGKPVKGPGYDDLLAMLSKVYNQPPEAVARSLPYCDPDARIDVQDMYDQLALWKKLGLADKDADPKQMLDLSFVKGNYNIPKN